LPDTPLIKKYHAQVVHGLQIDAHLYLAELDFLITGNTDELKKDFRGGTRERRRGVNVKVGSLSGFLLPF
jgi:hypothetical protein